MGHVNPRRAARWAASAALFAGTIWGGPAPAAKPGAPPTRPFVMVERSGRVAHPGVIRDGVLRAEMDQYLIEAESGVGIRIFQVTLDEGRGGRRRHATRLDLVGEMPLTRDLVAVAAFEGRIYAASGSGEIAIIYAGWPERPELAGWTRAPGAVHALEASGTLLYALGPDGLHVLDMEQQPPVVVAHDAAIHGKSLTISGRRLQVTSRNSVLTTYDIRLAEAQVFTVNVLNNFFSPADIEIEVGDTIRWRNLSGYHNVFSCETDRLGCDGVAANEVFTSGPAAGPPWLYTYTFTEAGFNPYVCIPHSPFMKGSVTVLDPTPPPLEVFLDVKPGSCVNPFNTGSRGVLPVAILGGPDLDVTTIDPASIRLEGVPPLRWSLEDVAAPPGFSQPAGSCEGGCEEVGPDGHLDLTLKFATPEMAAALGDVIVGQCLTVQLTGRLEEAFEGREILGTDAVLINARSR